MPDTDNLSTKPTTVNPFDGVTVSPQPTRPATPITQSEVREYVKAKKTLLREAGLGSENIDHKKMAAEINEIKGELLRSGTEDALNKRARIETAQESFNAKYTPEVEAKLSGHHYANVKKGVTESLGLKRRSSEAEITKAYKKQAKAVHPDSDTADPTRFKEIGKPYDRWKKVHTPEKEQIFQERGKEALAQKQAASAREKVIGALDLPEDASDRAIKRAHKAQVDAAIKLGAEAGDLTKFTQADESYREWRVLQETTAPDAPSRASRAMDAGRVVGAKVSASVDQAVDAGRAVGTQVGAGLDHAANIGRGAGVGMGALGMVSAIESGDKTQMAISGADVAISVAEMVVSRSAPAAAASSSASVAASSTASTVASSTSTAAPSALRTAAGTALKRGAVVVAVADGIYQVSQEDGALHKVQRATAVAASTGAAVGVGSYLTASAGVAAAGIGGSAVVTVGGPIVAAVGAAVGVAMIGEETIATMRIYEEEAKRFNANLETFEHARAMPTMLGKYLADEMREWGAEDGEKTNPETGEKVQTLTMSDGTEFILGMDGGILNFDSALMADYKYFSAVQDALDNKITDLREDVDEAYTWKWCGEDLDEYNGLSTELKVAESAREEMWSPDYKKMQAEWRQKHKELTAKIESQIMEDSKAHVAAEAALAQEPAAMEIQEEQPVVADAGPLTETFEKVSGERYILTNTTLDAGPDLSQGGALLAMFREVAGDSFPVATAVLGAVVNAIPGAADAPIESVEPETEPEPEIEPEPEPLTQEQMLAEELYKHSHGEWAERAVEYCHEYDIDDMDFDQVEQHAADLALEDLDKNIEKLESIRARALDTGYIRSGRQLRQEIAKTRRDFDVGERPQGRRGSGSEIDGGSSERSSFDRIAVNAVDGFLKPYTGSPNQAMRSMERGYAKAERGLENRHNRWTAGMQKQLQEASERLAKPAPEVVVNNAPNQPEVTAAPPVMSA